MNDANHLHLIGLKQIKNLVGELASQRSPDIPVYNGMPQRVLPNYSEN